MAGYATWLATGNMLEIGADVFDASKQGREANRWRTDEPPDDTYGDECQDHVSEIKMPLNGGKFHEFAKIPFSDNSDDQDPMPNTD